MRRVLYGAGETVFSKGDPSTESYRIVAGSVDIVVPGPDGCDRRIASIGPDEVFGEMGIIDPAPRSATAVTREPTVCDVYDVEEIIDLMARDPAQAMALVKALILRLRASNRKLAAPTPPGPPRRPAQG